MPLNAMLTNVIDRARALERPTRRTGARALARRVSDWKLDLIMISYVGHMPFLVMSLYSIMRIARSWIPISMYHCSGVSCSTSTIVCQG